MIEAKPTATSGGAPASPPRPTPATPTPTAAAETAPRPVEKQPDPTAPIDAATWERVLELGQSKAVTAAFLDGLEFASCEGDVASVTIREPRQRQFAEARRGSLEELFERASGRRVRVEFTLPVDGGGEATGSSREVDQATRTEAEANPVVHRAMELFDARVVDVEREPPSDG